jgi:hypothetical protein
MASMWTWNTDIHKIITEIDHLKVRWKIKGCPTNLHKGDIKLFWRARESLPKGVAFELR